MRWRGWLVDVLLVVLFAALTAAVAAGALSDVDLWVRDWADTHRPEPARLVAAVLNYLGQGTPLLVLSAFVALWLGRRAHSIRPLLPVAAAFGSLYLVVGLIKVLTDRAAPHKPEGVAHREEFFSGGLSYPSGHAANTIVWYGVLVLLLSEVLPAAVGRVARIGPPVLVALANTYLGYHWLTDLAAGLLIGLLLDRLTRRVDWNAVPLHRLPGGRWLAARGWVGTVPALSLR